ncbi:MAG: spore coat protein CotJB [Lachnospiraceae bacterium]|jgi:spore coat protein JB|nr:spore coat protein CotJB [Lachnospiraceae bacterium]MCI8994989.1 spore coat protein CotJB [Lachnospiraceae bacterium]MCI9134418.1 spore coat protein CotJB [Lachnospiraceae bacterium]
MNPRQRPNQAQLRQWIDMVSFACLETSLYLDTHPDCQEALAYYQKHLSLRRQALEEYARFFGPLTLDTAGSMEDRWAWISQPWPWEGGKC